jgi:hypothetical protein
MVLAAACRANASLTRLNLDGNRLGRGGAAALMAAVRKRSSASYSTGTSSDRSGCVLLYQFILV